ncbi:uncharacterized protein LODBEIA_P24140 [Lodderomyces beijingensis]|uniref:Alcohol acetyltransferase n=1 Tax=Lodderomyces beijingensis TaxID=1775926 RepID=A0ABP0ZPQ5_9ASCO
MVEARHKRRPDFNERYYIARSTEGFYSNFNIVAKYNKHVPRTLLSLALRNLVRQNSWFTHNFYKDAGSDSAASNGHNWTLQIVDQIHFHDVVTYRQIDQFNGSTLEEINKLGFGMNVPNVPLWRIIVFEEKISGEQLICAYFDHSQFDGLSGVQFQKDLARELALASQTAAKDQFEAVIFNYERDLKYLPKVVIPASESVTDLYTPPLTTVINHHLGAYLPFYKRVYDWVYTPSTAKEFVNPNPVRKDLSTKYKIFKFDASLMAQVTQFCRAHKLTVSSYLDVIVIKALQDSVFKAVYGTDEFTSNSYVAINGRRYYSQEIQNFRYGTMVCGDSIYLAPVRDSLQAMKKFSKQLCDHIGTQNSFKITGMLQYQNAWQFLYNKLGKVGARAALTLSNLGKVKDSNDIFQFKEMYFGANAGVMYNFVTNVTSLPSNEMTVVFGYLPEFEAYTIDGANAVDKFAELLERYFKDGVVMDAKFNS